MDMMRKLLGLFVFFTILTGCIYPFFITGLTSILFNYEASGSLLYSKGEPIGSMHIGQKFKKDIYFWGRPSASDYGTLPAFGSNLSPTSKKLKENVEKRVEYLKSIHGKEPPGDLVYASASGIDPHITIESALYQVDRIAKARNLQPSQINDLISKTELPYINVLRLNITLDQLQKR